MAKISKLQGIALGAFLASIFYLFAFTVIDFDIGEYFHQYIIAFLGGGATLFAAILALQGNQNQIAHSSQILEQERQAQLRSAAAVLPLALSSICDVSHSNMRRYFNAADLFSKGPIPDELVTLPEATIQTIKECIQFADQPLANHLAKITRTYQVLYGRGKEENAPHKLTMHSEKHDLHTLSDISSVIQWATLYALAEHLFDFSRGRQEFEADWKKARVGSAMHLCGIDTENFPLLAKMYQDRLENGRIGMFEEKPD